MRGRIRSAAGQALDDLAGAPADGAGLAVMLACAVAVAAEVLARSGRPRRGFVAGIGGLVAHGAGSARMRERFRRRNRRRGGRVQPSMIRTLAAAAALLCIAAPAEAQEIFGGVYAHDVNWVTRSGIEHGTDFELGVRGPRLHALDFIGAPRPHAFVSVNSAGDTHFAAAGVSWQTGGRAYLRPGIRVAVHTRPSASDPTTRRPDFPPALPLDPAP